MSDRVRHHTHGDSEIVRAIPVHEGAEIIIDQERPALQIIRRNDPTALNGMRQRTAIRTTYPALLPGVDAARLRVFQPQLGPIETGGQFDLTPQPMPGCQPSLDK